MLQAAFLGIPGFVTCTLMFPWIYGYQNVKVLGVFVNQFWFIVGYQQYNSIQEPLLDTYNGGNSFATMRIFLRNRFSLVKFSSRDFSGQNSTSRAVFHEYNTFTLWPNVSITFLIGEKSKSKWNEKSKQSSFHFSNSDNTF